MSDRLPGPNSPGEWLDHILNEMGDLSGLPVGEIRRLVEPELRVADVNHWSRPGLENAIRAWCKRHGLITDHASKNDEDTAAPMRAIEQLEFDGMIRFLRFRREQNEHNYAAAYAIADKWIGAHPDADMTAEELMRAAGW